MPNYFSYMAEYASQCYITDKQTATTNGAKGKQANSPVCTPITKRCTVRALPKSTSLDVYVFYVKNVRVVHMRENPQVGPLYSHMFAADVAKILSLPD